jgi:hypothetical protein
MHLLRYRDPFALKSLLGHTTLIMAQQYCEAVKQMDVVRADKVSIIDGPDTRGLDVRRSGRPKQQPKKTANRRSVESAEQSRVASSPP